MIILIVTIAEGMLMTIILFMAVQLLTVVSEIAALMIAIIILILTIIITHNT